MQRKTRTQSTSDARLKVEKIVHWLQEKQARDIVALDVHKVNAVTEALIIVSAINNPHAQTLADWLLQKLAENKMEFLGMEGYQTGVWILIDCNEVVVHIFQKEYREFYRLESLWSEVPRFF